VKANVVAEVAGKRVAPSLPVPVTAGAVVTPPALVVVPATVA
jgi:hypothetical protein